MYQAKKRRKRSEAETLYAQQEMPERLLARKRRRPLSKRQREIAVLVAERFRNREIAERLSISEGTVGTHLHVIYNRLGASGRVQLHNYVCSLRAQIGTTGCLL